MEYRNDFSILRHHQLNTDEFYHAIIFKIHGYYEKLIP